MEGKDFEKDRRITN